RRILNMQPVWPALLITLGCSLAGAVVAEPPPRTADAAAYRPLVHAILQNQVAEVRALLDRGLDANATVAPAKEDQWVIQQGDDPAPPLLVLAARFGVPESPEIRLLLEHGAKVNVADRTGRTPLMNAAQLGWMPAIEMLIEKGADVNARDAAGKTVLMYAMGNGNLTAVATLVEKGARVNDRDDGGRTPLVYAIANGRHDPIRIYGQRNDPAAAKARYAELVRFLIDHSGDVSAADRSGTTPLQLAASLREEGIAALLKQAGARK